MASSTLIPVAQDFDPWESAGLATPGDETESRFVAISPRPHGLEILVESDAGFRGEPVRLARGERFAGLHIRGLLGSGGMATVYRAWDPVERVEVALKVLNRGLVRDSRHLQRFRREAQVASRLRHPRIVSILTYGESGGRAYLTMPRVHGPTLEERVQRGGPLEPVRAAQVVEQVARAIDAAHRQRVVHRDLKPSNVMLHPEDGPLVLDFGLAKDLTRDPNLTDTGEVLGTPAFLAPEQVMPAGAPIDHRIDVYGLGAVLFFALTGKTLHPGDSAVEVIQHLLHHEPPRLREVDASLPASLEVVVAKALCRDPRDRYQTAGDFADDLLRFLAQEEIRARLPGRLQRLGRRARAHPLTSALALSLAALVIAGVVFGRAWAAQLALSQRSAQGLELLQVAQTHAQAGRHQEAELEFLQAMLVTKGAFLEDPGNPELKGALATVKRLRAEYAEARGNWALAQELRANLARLEGREPELEVAAPESAAGTIVVGGLSEEGRVDIFAWRGRQSEWVATASAQGPVVELPPGAYVAMHHPGRGAEAERYLLVVDAGRRHELRLQQDAAPPAGVFRLPPIAVLEQSSPVGREE